MKEHDIFIDDNKNELFGICLLAIYSCIESSTQHCTVVSIADTIFVKNLKRNINFLVTS